MTSRSLARTVTRSWGGSSLIRGTSSFQRAASVPAEAVTRLTSS
ncbi:hypothetical protein ACFPRL_04880 [Pseudoclavibacter helvolus]